MRSRLLAFLSLGILGCASPGEDPAAGDKPTADLTKPDLGAGKAEGWGANDNPSTFSSGLEFGISKLPTSGQAQNIPWASTYWPTYQDNINYKWDGPGSTSASGKY